MTESLTGGGIIVRAERQVDLPQPDVQTSGRAALEALGVSLASAVLYVALAFSQRGLAVHSHRYVWALAYTAAVSGLFGAYCWTIRSAGRWHSTLALTVAVVAPALVAVGWWLQPPTLSIDVYSYLADGYLWRAGLNPYLHGPRELRDTAIGTVLADAGWRPVHGISPYGPLWMAVEVLAARVVSDVARAVLLVKGIVIAAWALTAAAVYRAVPNTTRSTRVRSMVVFTWNPLILTQLAAEAHNDAVMVLAVILGLGWIVRQRVVAGTLSLTAGVLAKYLPLLFAASVLAYLWKTRRDLVSFTRSLAAGVLLGAAAATLFYAPFWADRATWEGVRAAGHVRLGPGTAGMMMGLLSPLPPALAAQTTSALSAAILLAVVCVVSVKVRDARSLIVACGTIALTYVLIATPRYWPWYAVLPAGILALNPSRRAIQLTVILTLGAMLVAPLDMLRVAGAIGWISESLVMTMVGVWVPLVAWIWAARHSDVRAPAS